MHNILCYVFLFLITAFLAAPASAAERPEKYKEPEKYRIWREAQIEAKRPEKPAKDDTAANVEGRRQVTVDGVKRNYSFMAAKKPVLLAEATTVATKKELSPLLVVLEDPKGMRDSVRLGVIPDNAATSGRAVAFLEFAQESSGLWNDGRAGTVFKGKDGNVIDDVAYFNAVLADIKAQGLADTSSVFIAGSGAGSILAQRIVCRGETVLLGAMFFLATTPAPFEGSCARKTPLSLMVFHATKDALFPFDGAKPADLPPIAMATPMLSGAASTDFWRKFAGCKEKSSNLSPADTKPDDEMSVSHLRYDGCAGKKTVDWITIEGGGHNLPFGPNAGPVGRGGTEIFAPRNYDFDVSIAAEDFMKRAGGK